MRPLLPVAGVRLRGLALLVGVANSQMYGSLPSLQAEESYLSRNASQRSVATASRSTWTQASESSEWNSSPGGSHYSATRRDEPVVSDTSGHYAQYAQPTRVVQDFLFDIENATTLPNRLVEETTCEEYANSMPKRGPKKSKNSIDAAFKCRDGGFLALRQGVRSMGADWSMVVAKRGERKASEVCVEIVPHAVNPSDLSSNVRLRGGKAETLFTLRFRMRLDGAPGGFVQINNPPAKPTWVVTATIEGGEDHLFRITCSHDDEGQWVHLQHVKSRAYINCIGNRNVRGHGTPPQQFYGARREVSTGLEFVPCPDMQLNSKDAGYLTA